MVKYLTFVLLIFVLASCSQNENEIKLNTLSGRCVHILKCQSDPKNYDRIYVKDIESGDLYLIKTDSDDFFTKLVEYENDTITLPNINDDIVHVHGPITPFNSSK